MYVFMCVSMCTHVIKSRCTWLNSKGLNILGSGKFVLSSLSVQTSDSIGLYESEIEEHQETDRSKDFSFFILYHL